MSIDAEMAAVLREMLASRNTFAGTVSERLTNPWRQNPFVRSAVGALYRITKGIPTKAMAGRKSDPNAATELPAEHPLSMLLAAPTTGVYGSEIWAQCLAMKKLDGHAFVVLFDSKGYWRREGGSVTWPRAMQAVAARHVWADESDIDQETGIVRRWRVRRRDGLERQVPAEAVIHLRDFDPDDPIRCSSPLSTVWAGMEADLNVDTYVSAWLKHLGAIGTWLQSKVQVSDAERKEILAAFNQAFGGSGNAGKTFMSGPDLDVKPGPTPQSARDMEMPRLREWNRDVIKAALAVTDYEVGRIADYNRANSEAARRWLIENTILPELEAFESAFWGHVAEPVSRRSRSDEWMRFDRAAVPVLQSAIGETATTAATLVGAGYDAEAVSEKLGLNLPVADYEEPEPPPPAEPVKSGLVIITKKAKPIKPLPRRVALRLQQQWADHAERKLGVRWRRFTRKRYEETIRLVRNLTDLGPLPAATVERLRTTGASLVGNVEMELGGFARIDVGQEAYQLAAAKRVGQMVNVGEKLRVRVRESIIRGIAEAESGLDVDGLEKIIQQRFGARLPSNAATVARTEVGIFASDVRRSLMVAEGVEEHEWSAAMDEHTRETHRAVDGERRPMNERFSNGLMHPLETGAPAGEVVNCRCVELPYMREVEE